MARKKIREYDSKRLLKAHIRRLAGLDLPLNAAQVRNTTNFQELVDENPWLKDTRLVVKPDMLFGKRGKHDLVGTCFHVCSFIPCSKSLVSVFKDDLCSLYKFFWLVSTLIHQLVLL